jgi:hypothetical protein
LSETKPNKHFHFLLLGFILFNPTYRTSAVVYCWVSLFDWTTKFLIVGWVKQPNKYRFPADVVPVIILGFPPSLLLGLRLAA